MGFEVVEGSLLVHDRFGFKVRLPICIDKPAYLVSTAISCVALRLSIKLFMEHFYEARYIRLLKQEVNFRLVFLVFNKG